MRVMLVMMGLLAVASAELISQTGQDALAQGASEDYEATIAVLTDRLQQVESMIRHRAAMKLQTNMQFSAALGLVRSEPDFSSHPDWDVQWNEWRKTWWPYVGGVFAVVCLLLLMGAINEVVAPAGQKLTWADPLKMITAYVRESDTFKQLCPYNPWFDPGQAPSPNPYRLMAIVGPNSCDAIQPEGDDDDGFKYTLPSRGGYVGMFIMTMLTLIMQLYFPWKLVTGKLYGGDFVFHGLKTVVYYQDNLGAVFLDLVPLTVMSAKFFVQVEDKIRGEFNQCLFLWRFLVDTDLSYAGKYVGVNKAWSWMWISISLGINTYIAVLMTFFVVLSICTQSGDLMSFILSIFGSLGMIDFDDTLMGALPQWTQWYAEHTARCHPQGGHWAGCPADFFGGPESVKSGDAARETGGLRADKLAADKGGSRNEFLRKKYVKVGIQLTNERPSLGFFFVGNTITKVSASGAAARAINMSVLDRHRQAGEKWDDTHRSQSASARGQGASQKGGSPIGVEDPALGQPTERDGLIAMCSVPSNERFGTCPMGNFYGRRFPFLYCGSDFTWEKVKYDGDATSTIDQDKKIGFIRANTKLDIASDPVVKGRDVLKMIRTRPWQQDAGDKIESADEDADFLLRGVGLEPGMCIWKINDKPVSTPDQIREELRLLKGDCLNHKTSTFDQGKLAAVSSTGHGKESFNAVPWNTKEFTMTLSVAGDEDSKIDDLFHSLFYTLIRILLLGSLLLIFCVYVTNAQGVHVGI
eukprot:TRINITY_DN7730_c5_g1_i1.p2 TRINITY_DN7730_c5_g1~~TRINITY_DN7730_c5_g1_i1.p2  ORF type:complete len:752 (+),score=301.92 TRINITY_DN7730_c5_g1_i1:99-2354(+)